MKYLYVAFVLLLLSCETSTFENDKEQIVAVMKQQEKAWSNHDIEGFMQGYWESDSLEFYGSSGLTYGWQQTLENYKKNYPTKADTGVLKFTTATITKIEDNTYYVMGNYYLKRDIGNAEGVFMIIFKKIEDKWKIVADMSC